MKGRFYWWMRDLHLYTGLFVSPFVLAFSISVFFLVHSGIPKLTRETTKTRIVPGLALPRDPQKLSGRPLIDALKPILQGMNVPGEIGFVRHMIKEEKLIIPVSIPGRLTTVTVNLTNHEATIVTHETGLADALINLHRSPGPHGPGIRMNWFYMKVWRWFADATVYIVLFLSFSGIYLWYMLRAERRIGLILLFAGTLSFFGIVYAISY